VRTHLDIQHSGTMGDADRTRMTFDQDATAHLMAVLTDLYADPQLAVIREYSTNGWDSHVEAGNTATPIEITLPTSFNNLFVVTDHGIGMSLETINERFSKYGWSSKRDTDEQTGSLGLGCKSALSLAGQFTLVSRHNGLRITVLITREADGAGTVQIVDTAATDDANGVTVSIPVANRASIAEKAQRFFGFWEPGRALVDGEDLGGRWFENVLDFDPSAIRVDPDVTITSKIGSSYVVMGGVPYPIDPEKLQPLGKWQVVARVPMGAVNFTPNREALHYTKRTSEVIADLEKFTYDILVRRIQGEIDACPTHAAAVRKRAELGESLNWRDGYYVRPHPVLSEMLENATYRGERIPKSIEIPRSREMSIEEVTPWAATTVHYKNMTDAINVTVFVTGFKGGAVPRPTKLRLGMWAEEMELEDGYAVFVEDLPHAHWFDESTIVDVETIRSIVLDDTVKAKIKRVNSTAGRRYSLIGSHKNLDNPADRPNCKVACWVEAQILVGTYSRESIYHVMPDGQACASVPKNQLEKFLAENPDVPHFVEWVKHEMDRRVAALSEWEIAKLAARSFEPPQGLRYLDPEQISDAELADFIRGARGSRDYSHGYHSIVNIARRLGLAPPSLPSTDVPERWRRMGDRYPLLRSGHGVSSADRDAIHEYLNALHFKRLCLQPSPY
jgi:hypothetical protein